MHASVYQICMILILYNVSATCEFLCESVCVKMHLTLSDLCHIRIYVSAAGYFNKNTVMIKVW